MDDDADNRDTILEMKTFHKLKNETLMFLNVIKMVTKRCESLDHYEDPTIKYITFIEILDMAIDIGLQFLSTQYVTKIDDAIFKTDSEEMIQKYDALKKTFLTEVIKNRMPVDKFMCDLKQHVLTPHYNPDHPFGNKIMNDHKKSFDELSKSS